MTNNLDRLADLLNQMAESNEDVMMLEQLDGFLAGVLVSPDMIPTSQWLPHLWDKNGSAGEKPAADNLKQIEKLLKLVMEHYNSIATSLLPGSEYGYEPVLSVVQDTDIEVPHVWGLGFARALTAYPASWMKILSSGNTEALDALGNLRKVANIATGQSSAPEDEEIDFMVDAVDQIGEWVETLAWWRMAQSPVATASAQQAFRSVGRNDPCPCGSGRKFKHCHGAN